MSDDSQTPSPDGGSEEPFRGVSETELDDLLAQAGSLADQLSVELGHAEVASAESAANPVCESKNEAASLDHELAQLDELVTAASHEVGEAPAEPTAPEEPGIDLAPEQPAPMWDPQAEADFKNLFPGGKLPPPPPLEVIEQAMTPPEHLNMPTSLTNPHMQPPAPRSTVEPPPGEEPDGPTAEDAPAEENQVDDDIPDFMREFMEPETPREAPSEPAVATTDRIVETTSMPVQTKPGVVGTGMLHKIVRPDRAGKQDQEKEAPVEAVALSEADALRARLKGLLRLFKRIPSPAPALGGIAFIVCDKGIALLEKVDKPMERLGYRVRTLIGWIAMATLGMSVVVYLISLF